MQVGSKRTGLRDGILFSTPWLIGFILFIVYPIIQSIYYSFTDFNLFQVPRFVGVQNYSSLFSDELFYQSLYNTLYMTFIGSPIYISIGLLLAVLLNNKIKALAFFRTIFYIPYILPIWLATPVGMYINNRLDEHGFKSGTSTNA
ncbi:hypothetical protein MASR2M78_04430 [Treponema sp.]